MQMSFVQSLVAKYPTLLALGASLKITNEPWMELCAEYIGPGPTGRYALSLCHYGELNGDLMRDPEMIFELDFDNGAAIDVFPYYWRNDWVGIEKEVSDYNSKQYSELVTFASLWNQNLLDQGFLIAEAVIND